MIVHQFTFFFFVNAAMFVNGVSAFETRVFEKDDTAPEAVFVEINYCFL